MSVDIFAGASSTWTCPYCTFINKDELIGCATCCQPRPGHKKQRQKPGKKEKETWTAWFNRKLGHSNSRSDKRKTQPAWFCKKCNKLNESSKCDTCVRKNNTSPGWTCSQCTYLNTNIADVCEGCGNCRWGDGSHDTPHDDDTPVDVVVISDDDDVMIVDHQDKPEHTTPFDPAIQWECVDCSYYNDNKQSRCEACDGTNKKTSMVTPKPAFNPSTHWECSKCSLHNSNKDLQCTVCGSRRKHPSVDEPASSFDHVTQWQCAQCSLYNDNKWRYCRTCYGTEKSIDNTGKPLTVAFNPSAHWKCPACPTINNMAHIQCVACGTQKKHPKMDTSPFNPATQWQCADCSLYNSNTCSHCTACHGTKKTIPNDTESSSSTINLATHWECIHCSLHNSNSRNWCAACHQWRPKDDTSVTLVKPVRPVIPYTKQISVASEPEESISKRTRLYTNHTALVSMSVKSKRYLIDQDALATYEEILKFCAQDKSGFVDPEFLPGPQSLYKDPSKSSQYWRVNEWLRPREIRCREGSSVKWTVYRNPEPGDISQGALGTCWFLSALAVLAEKPELVEQIIINKHYTEQGVYLLRLCKDGWWGVVQVDDYLPCTKDRTLVFSKSLRKQLWVPLIEKALAKLYGSYEAIEAGFVLNGLSILTGYPCENFRLQNNSYTKSKEPIDDNLLWVKLLSFREAGFLMGASCGGRDTVSRDDCQAMGLQYAHAYSILDVVQVDHLRLLKLRNPHGHGSRETWRGNWSDHSPLWAPQLKQLLLPHGENQGIFWICLHDLMKYFSDVDVCKYHPDWFVERVKGELLPYIPAKMAVMAVEIVETCEVDICLYQPSCRNKMVDFLVDLVILVMRYKAPEDNMLLECIPLPVSCVSNSNCSIKSCVSVSSVLDPGYYAILPISFNILSEFFAPQSSSSAAAAAPTGGGIPYTLAIFSSKVVVTEMGQTHEAFLAQSLFLLAQKIGKKTEAFSNMWLYDVHMKDMCHVIIAENHSSYSYFTVTVDCNDSNNLISSRGTMFSTDCIAPKHRQVLAILTQLDKGGGYYFNASFEFSSFSKLNIWENTGASQTPPVHIEISAIHSPQPIN